MQMKSTKERLDELATSLRLVHKSVQHFHAERDACYLLAILSQLRALVSFNPREAKASRRSLRPLLLDLAEQAKVPLRLFSIPPKPKHGPKGLAAAILCSKTWSVSPQPNYHEYALEEWLVTPAYHLDSKNLYKSRNDVIRQLSEKGAVHYDPDVGEMVDSMRRSFGSQYNGVEFFVIDTASAVFYLGTRFLYINDLIAEGVPDPDKHERIKSLDQDFDTLRISMA